MEIKVVFMWKSPKAGAFKALCNLEFFFDSGEAFRVNGFKIMDGTNGLFVNVPSTQRLDKVTKQPVLDKNNKQVWDKNFECNEATFIAISEKVLSVYESGSGIEQATFGQPKKAAEPVGAVSSFAPSKNTVAIDTADNDIPF